MKKVVLAVLMVAGVMALVGCSTIERGADTVKDGAEDVAENVQDSAEGALDKAEDLGDTIQEGAENLLDGNEAASVASDARMNADQILADMQLTDQAILNVTDRDMSTVRYEFRISSDDVDTSDSALESRIMQGEQQFASSLSSLKEKGVNNASVVVEFLDQNGTKLYEKTYQ